MLCSFVFSFGAQSFRLDVRQAHEAGFGALMKAFGFVDPG
jgi:hypothetical protein